MSDYVPDPPPKDPKVPENISKIYQRERAKFEEQQKLQRYFTTKGSRMFPFNIEHMPFERNRLAGQGMTPEDRSLRYQHLKDRILDPTEPRYVPELRPRNIFKRLVAYPWDVLFNALRPAFRLLTEKEWPVSIARRLIPRTLFGVAVGYYCLYYMIYRQKTWERKQGWRFFPDKPTYTPGQHLSYDEPTEKDFNDLSFSKRDALLDVKKTSFTNYPIQKGWVSYYEDQPDAYEHLNEEMANRPPWLQDAA